MSHIFTIEVLDSFHDLPEVLDSLFLVESFLLPEVGEHIMITQLGDDIHVIAGLEYIVQLNYIVVPHFFHDVDLTVQVLEVKGIAKQPFIDDFDSHWLAGFNDPAFVYRCV